MRNLNEIVIPISKYSDALEINIAFKKQYRFNVEAVRHARLLTPLVSKEFRHSCYQDVVVARKALLAVMRQTGEIFDGGCYA